MNAQTPSPTPPPVPMEKEKVVKEDGRFLFYYWFPSKQADPESPAGGEKTEDGDV